MLVERERAAPRLMAVRVAVDVGGTFTDICILDESDLRDPRREGPLDPADPMEGVMAGVRDAGIDLRDTVLFSHGTTVATNALITRRFPPVAMVTTQGFRDVIEIRRGTKEDLWDAYADVAPPYIRRRDRFEVPSGSAMTARCLSRSTRTTPREVARVLRRRGWRRWPSAS